MELSKKQIVAGTEVDIPARWETKEEEGLRSVRYNKTTNDFEIYVVGILNANCKFRKGEVVQKATTLEEIVETVNQRYDLTDTVIA